MCYGKQSTWESTSLSSPDKGSLRDSLSLGSMIPSSALAAAMMNAVPHTTTTGAPVGAGDEAVEH